MYYDPGAAAAAHAFAAVLDRVAFGTVPVEMARESLRQQAACLACAVAARPDDWVRFRTELERVSDDPVELALAAVALGWASKWT